MKIQSIRILCLVLATFSTLPSLHADAGSAIADAWKAWDKGDHRLVEQRFLDALGESPDDPRALLGLSFLYSLEQQEGKAWEMYSRAMDHLPSRYPYLYAAWLTPGFIANDDPPKGVALLKELREHPDSLGVMSGTATELLGRYYWGHNDLETAREYYRQMNCVTDWMLIGPFDNTSASGYDKTYPPETEFAPDREYRGKIGVPARWFKPLAVRNDNWIDITYYFADPLGIYYANTFVYSPTRRDVDLRLGTSGSFKLLLNDEPVNESSDEYNNDLDTYIARTTLQQGWNRVLVKCGASDIDRCNFLLRITDAHGNAIPGLRTETERHDYHSRPGATSVRLDNFAESFFREQIARYPDRLENYLLLADCYLRNDKAVEAELTLHDAIRLAPDCVPLYDRLLEAYRIDDKDDEWQKTLDKIESIDPGNPSVLTYRFYEAIKAENNEKAEQLLGRYEALFPDNASIYDMRMQLYAARSLSDKVLETAHEAFERYPNVLGYVTAEALLASRVRKNDREAAGLYEDYLKSQHSEQALVALAELYLGMSDQTRWRKTYDRLLEFSPASSGYYFRMANTYSQMRDYPNVEENLKKCIALCPNSSTYWAKLGEVHRIQNRTDEAIRDYRTALSYDPTDYDIRSTLRELEGKKSIFEQFERIDVDSVVRYARTMQEDSDEPGVILLDDARRVIYDDGASESSQELVVKVFNGRGIDDWKEYDIGQNPYSEELNIEKAVVVKQDGAEVKADIDDGYVVFKSLEPNDVIHLRWKIKNHYSGKLFDRFWDSYYFNGFYAVRHIRYELLTPKGFKFDYATQNMNVEPVKTDVAEGTIYRWSLDNLPAISEEYGMPTLEDVGSILHISNIGGWSYLVDWYSDIATTKTKSSSEIREQVRSLFPDTGVSDEEKMEGVYNFITENIRYSSVAFRQGAQIPQKARDVLVNRIGDCKDVSTLCIAMLRELGMTAYYVLVNTRDEGLNEHVLPSIAFNHCIVAVETSKGERYLDLTANNYPIGSTPEGDMGAFALVIKPGVTKPMHLPTRGSLSRTITTRITAELRADNSLRSMESTTLTGTLAAAIRSAFRDQAKKDVEKSFTATLASYYPNVKLNSLEMQHLDELTPDVEYRCEYETPNYLSEAGDFKLFKIPWSYPMSTDEALSYEERDYPYEYWPGEDTLDEEVTIRIPEGYGAVELPKPVRLASSVADYSVQYAISNGNLVARRRIVNKKLTVSPEEYSDFRTFHNSMVKEDHRQILLRPQETDRSAKKGRRK